MPLKEQVYNVLLVSASKAMNDGFKEILQPSRFASVRTVSDVSTAKRACSDQSFDIVIVNSPLPNDPGIRFAIDACGSETVVLLLVRSEIFDDVTERVYPHGVFTLSKPSSKNMVYTAIQWLISARERLRKTEKKTLKLEEKMEELRIVNRAKWVLIEKQGMDESSAHRYIEKQAL
ncbi:MAG: ANTAR domain-containing protein, partial [Clostridia bacterium]|nr:ANTAR domain-containing protein [Clostridia bacterium]